MTLLLSSDDRFRHSIKIDNTLSITNAPLPQIVIINTNKLYRTIVP